MVDNGPSSGRVVGIFQEHVKPQSPLVLHCVNSTKFAGIIPTMSNKLMLLNIQGVWSSSFGEVVGSVL